MARRVTKKTPLPRKIATGQYAVQAVDAGVIRLDLYDSCIPAATGEVTEGWGCVFLTYGQALGLARVLTNAARLVKPDRAPAKRKG